MNILISGVSSGFGREMARIFVRRNYQVIGIARRQAKLDALSAELGERFYALCADVGDRETLAQALAVLPENFARIDVLVNNAGLALGLEGAYAVAFSDWETMVQTNVIGAISLTHLVLPQMVARNSGYIINIGSTAGSYPYFGGNVYGATKAFLKQFSLNLRADLAGKNIRVTNVEPGLCGETEFSNVRFKGDDAAAANLYQGANALTGVDIANTVHWLVNQPEHINVNRIEIMPTSQSFAGLSVYKDA